MDPVDSCTNLTAKLQPLTIGAKAGDVDADGMMYDAGKISSLRLSAEAASALGPDVTPTAPGEGLRLRPLHRTDFDRGFLELLGQLTTVGDISKEQFQSHFDKLKSCSGTYFNTVIEDVKTRQIVGAATLVVERKFIHKCASRGIIEEVVVSESCRGRQLGKLIVLTLVELAKTLGCYKITLNCTDQMIKFYTSLGFQQESGNANFLQIRVPGPKK